VVEETTDTLIELGRIGQFLKSRIAHAAAFKKRRKAILDHLERRLCLARPAPSVIDNNLARSRLASPSKNDPALRRLVSFAHPAQTRRREHISPSPNPG
jgi:hypothetical protein